MKTNSVIDFFQKAFRNRGFMIVFYTISITFHSIIFMAWFCITYAPIGFKYVSDWIIYSNLIPDPETTTIEYIDALIPFISLYVMWLGPMILCAAGAVIIIEKLIINKSSLQKKFMMWQKHLVLSKLTMIGYAEIFLVIIYLVHPWMTLNIIKGFILFLFFPLVFSGIFSLEPLLIIIFLMPILAMICAFSIWPPFIVFIFLKFLVYTITVPITFYTIFGNSDMYKEFKEAWEASTTYSRIFIVSDIIAIFYFTFFLVIAPIFPIS
jgi:hypothetical protein